MVTLDKKVLLHKDLDILSLQDIAGFSGDIKGRREGATRHSWVCI